MEKEVKCENCNKRAESWDNAHGTPCCGSWDCQAELWQQYMLGEEITEEDHEEYGEELNENKKT